MKFLVVVTPLSIYHGCFPWKTFWEENFTGKEDLFLSVNMKNCGCCKVMKHKEIKGSYKNVNLDISSKFDSLNKMKNHIFRVKSKIGMIRKGVGYRSVFQDQSKVAKVQKGKVFHCKYQ